MNPNRRLAAVRPVFTAVARPITAFFRLEAASGIALLAATGTALGWVNLGGAEGYRAFFDRSITLGIGEASARFTLHQLVNDGLMTLFFFVVGMEIKRELVLGELRSPARAALPAIAAAGGMAVPAALFLAFNRDGPGRMGWGIPMATDIAFCIGVLTLLKTRVSHGLIVFVTALAIFDDIGGILVIALFYGHGLSAWWLSAAAAGALALVVMSRARVGSGAAYGIAGALLWYAFHRAGVHATIAGVVVGLAVPARSRRPPREALEELEGHTDSLLRRPSDEGLDCEAITGIEERLQDLEAPVNRLVRLLHPAVAFFIIPLFALANSGVDLRGLGLSQLTGRVAAGTAVALVAGKLTGVFTFTAAAVKLGVAPMPGRASWAKLLGVSITAGIGFTVALFIAALAYPQHPELLDQAKVGILAGSLVAGIAGAVALRLTPAAGAAGKEEPGEERRQASPGIG